MENVDINYINFGVKVVMAVAGDGGSRYALCKFTTDNAAECVRLIKTADVRE